MNTNKLHAEALRTNRQFDKLTAAARKAHASYRTARYRNLKPVQSPAEVKANARYAAKRDELAAFCKDNGLRVPKTWA
jgi:hypothetical protein